MNKLIQTIGLASVLTLASANVLAGDRYHDDDRRYFGTHSERAKVVDVDPIYKYVRVTTPERECWQEPRRYNDRNHSYTSTIAGGLVGGVIGNQFGGGSGKTALTIAGTLLGGSIGRDYEHNNRAYSAPVRYETQCRVSNHHHKERVFDGYNVTYRYQGKLYSTHMDHRPGKFIDVDVDVTPRHYANRDYYDY
jgi:uncharacterized protein YcfJ